MTQAFENAPVTVDFSDIKAGSITAAVAAQVEAFFQSEHSLTLQVGQSCVAGTDKQGAGVSSGRYDARIDIPDAMFGNTSRYNDQVVFRVVAGRPKPTGRAKPVLTVQSNFGNTYLSYGGDVTNGELVDCLQPREIEDGSILFISGLPFIIAAYPRPFAEQALDLSLMPVELDFPFFESVILESNEQVEIGRFSGSTTLEDGTPRYADANKKIVFTDFIHKKNGVSNQHAAFRYEFNPKAKEPTFLIMDRDSTNGTWLNNYDNKLNPNQWYKVENGDYVALGKSIFRVVVQELPMRTKSRKAAPVYAVELKYFTDKES